MSRHRHLVLTPVAARIQPALSAPLAVRLDAALAAALPSLLRAEHAAVAHIAQLLDAVAQQPGPADLRALELGLAGLKNRLRQRACAGKPGLRAIAWLDRALASERAEIMDAAWAPRWLHTAEMRWLDKLNRDLDNYQRWQDLVLAAVADVPDARIEDVAAGAAGFLLWLAEHSPRRDLHLTASDYSADYVALGQDAARRASPTALPLAVVQRDATQLAQLAGQVDLIVSTQATHHMSAGLVARLLHQGLRAAHHGVLLIDVLRSFGGLLAASVGTHLSTPAPPLVIDAMQSVRRGFLPTELALLAYVAGASEVRAEAHGPAYAVLRARR